MGDIGPQVGHFDVLAEREFATARETMPPSPEPTPMPEPGEPQPEPMPSPPSGTDR